MATRTVADFLLLRAIASYRPSSARWWHRGPAGENDVIGARAAARRLAPGPFPRRSSLLAGGMPLAVFMAVPQYGRMASITRAAPVSSS